MNTEDVWKFTVALYGRPRIAELCLELQDRCGLDVNMLLFMLWLGRKGYAPHSIAALEAAVRDWRENVILPLRATRRHLRSWERTEAQKLRESVKRDELAAERVEQQLLCEAVESVPAKNAMAAAHAYLSPTRFSLSQAECDEALARIAAEIKAASL